MGFNGFGDPPVPRHLMYGVVIKVQGSGFRVQGSGFRVKGFPQKRS